MIGHDFFDAVNVLIAGEDALALMGLHDLSESPARLLYKLVDNCGGRFEIDENSGVIAVASQHIVESEFGRIFSVRVNDTIETYTLSLKITGPVPLLATNDSYEDFGLDAVLIA
ncbi:MAG: hypothetical protein ABW199_04515 [Caulobacterales bacterium]